MSKFMLRDSGCETDDDDLTCEDGLPGLDIDDVEVTYASGVMMSAPTAALPAPSSPAIDPVSLAVRHVASELQRVVLPEWFGPSDDWELLGAEINGRLRRTTA